MGRLPSLITLGSKLVLGILPSVAATVIGGYLLSQIHFGQASQPPVSQQAAVPPAATQESPTVREERAAMRDVLKARRENPETPEQVRTRLAVVPAPASAPANATLPAATLPVAMDSIAPNEPIDRAAASSRTNITAAIPPRREAVAPRTPPEVATVYVPAPPPGLPQAPAVTPGVAQPTPLSPAVAPLPPVVASIAEPPLAPAPEPRGPVGAVFSTLSSFVGHAANATGSTVNWVIDLPGKAISAGGRVIGVNPPPPPSRPFS